MAGLVIDSKTATTLDLQVASTIEVQRKKIGVGENTFLTNGEC